MVKIRRSKSGRVIQGRAHEFGIQSAAPPSSRSSRFADATADRPEIDHGATWFEEAGEGRRLDLDLQVEAVQHRTTDPIKAIP